MIFEDDVEKKAQPSRVSRFIYNYPCIVIAVVNILAFATIIVIASLGFSFNRNSSRDYVVWDDKQTLRNDGYILAQQTVNQFGSDQLPVRVESIDSWATFIIYKSKTGNNVLTPTNIAQMTKIENYFQSMNDNQYSQLCLAYNSTNSTCHPQTKALQSVILQNSNIVDLTLAFLSFAGLFDEIKFLYGKEMNDSYFKSKYARSLFRFGMPLETKHKRYKSQLDHKSDQEQIISNFVFDFYQYVKGQSTKDMDVYVFNQPLILKALYFYALKDYYWLIASILFALGYMILHTRSILKAVVILYQAIIAFPISYFIYCYIFQIKYINAFVIFIAMLIIGIAADNLYVFIDAWDQSKLYKSINNSLLLRFSYTYRRVRESMFATTLTTAISFLGVGVIPIMPISTFGYFSLILIIVNYVLVITNFAALLIFLEKYKHNRLDKKNKQKQLTQVDAKENLEVKNVEINNIPLQMPQENNKNNNENQNDNINNNNNNQAAILDSEVDKMLDDNQIDKTENKKISKNNSETQLKINDFKSNLQENQDSSNKLNENNTNQNLNDIKSQSLEFSMDKSPNLKKIEIFFGGVWYQWMHRLRFVILALFLAWFIICAVFVSKINTPVSIETFLPGKDIVMKGINTFTKFYEGRYDLELKVNFIWGIKGVDRSKRTSIYDTTTLGDVIWDDSFSLTKQENQQFLLDVCNQLESNLSYILIDSKLDQMNCFMKKFYDFETKVQGNAFPVPESQFQQEINAFSLWDNGTQFVSQGMIGFIGSNLKFVSIQLITNQDYVSKQSTMQKNFDLFENIMIEMNKRAPVGLQHGYQDGDYSYQNLIFEKTFMDNFELGVILSFVFSFCVALIVTLNILLSLYSVLSVIGIFLSVLAIIQFKNLAFGILYFIISELRVLEAVASSLIIGFSFDYTIYMCLSYIQNGKKKREERMQLALTYLPVSIIAGAITTIGSVVFLFACYLGLFSTVGIIGVTTICFSLLWSLLFFPTICLIIGPSNEQGNLKHYFKQLVIYIQSKRRQQSQVQ